VRFDDPAYVREQYATEAGLAARASVYGADGQRPQDLVVRELQRLGPRRILEVGCGRGELAERIERELGCDLAAVDQSARMVELARERGVDAVVGDVQALPFGDGAFDAAVAAWMLYHVLDLDGAIAELARVLRPGGILCATTNAADDFDELWRLVGRDPGGKLLTFRAENGAALLGAHFAAVRRQDVVVGVTFPDGDAIRRYVGSSELGKPCVDRVPHLDGPFVATKRVAVFTATR
jgi:SAM-dependent methyltransferase